MQSDLFDPPRPSKVPLDVIYLFEKLALQVFAAGFEHYSADEILHRIRWHHHVDVGDRSFKCNNNWTAPLSRWFMLKHPEVGRFFRIRASPHRGGPRHSSEDYMGPVEGPND